MPVGLRLLCTACNKNISDNFPGLSCSICHINYHLKCTSGVITEVVRDFSDWCCEYCLKSVFPFNHIDDDDEFLNAIYACHLPINCNAIDKIESYEVQSIHI